MTLAYAGSFANLIFGGALAPYASRAMLAALISSVITMLVLSLRSSFEFSLGGPDSNPSAILAVSVAAIAHSIVLKAGLASSELLPTVLLFIFVSSLGCGLVLYAIGERKLGRYVRFIPHPVVGGFLAGTGYLLVMGAYKMLMGVSFGTDVLARISECSPLAWSTAVAVAAILTVLSRFTRHYLVIPLVLLGAITGFYLLLFLKGTNLEEARRLGLLVEPLRVGEWRNVVNFPYSDVRWDLVLLHWQDFMAMTMVVVIAILLNATSLDLATGRDADVDRELQAVGIANILSGLCGGMVSVNSFNRSMLNLKAGANSPWAARVCAGVVLLIILAAPNATGLLPRPVLTGLIAYLGISLLLTWAWESRQTMPLGDYLMVFAILIMVAVWGMVAGVLLGVILACLSFVFTFSRMPAVKYAFNAKNRRSNVERTTDELRWLFQNGPVLRGFALQGFLFFGTANSLLDEVRQVLRETRYLVLDFRLVRGIDASSAMMLKKIKSLCDEAHVHLVITGLSPVIVERLRQANFDVAQPKLQVQPDLDHGLEWCENRIIAETTEIKHLVDAFTGAFETNEVAILYRYFEHIHVRAQTTLVRQGDESDAMFIVEQGQVSVYLRTVTIPTENGFSKRLRSYGAGTVVGEMGFYSGEDRSADIVADLDTRALSLTTKSMTSLEKDHPQLGHKLHRYVIRVMAGRLRAANEEIRLLL